MKYIEGGVCAAKGFSASGVHCGIRKNKSKKDLALIVSEVKASAAAVYTKNLVKGAPLTVTKSNIENGFAKAIICNSGNANTCNENGVQVAQDMCRLTSEYLNIEKSDVIVASTGVIGQTLDIQPISDGMNSLVKNLGHNSKDAARAIMTTDTDIKEIAVSFEIDGKTCNIGGIAKGSGMIHPNMATMLGFITTDVAIEPEMLQKALKVDVCDSFNMVSVDGDTSTNDMVCVLANAMAENPVISSENKAYNEFAKALNVVTTALSKSIAKDGEGASKLLECKVYGAVSKQNARAVAKSVVCSNLLKSAMFGADANWGRVLCAIGYSGVSVDVDKIDVEFKSSSGSVPVCENGRGIDFDESKAKNILLESEIDILINLNSGEESATAWGCDLTYDYVKINGDYRT
ncbi:MAG TPA: bifunctional ornithine acetyltransferase/N-acetylglutamate synthase [Clostridia bacterium]|nr:bifunctional ornithine acetyltransferase/N-acetylglutamate synthase [Clostridia bacterium]